MFSVFGFLYHDIEQKLVYTSTGNVFTSINFQGRCNSHFQALITTCRPPFAFLDWTPPLHVRSRPALCRAAAPSQAHCPHEALTRTYLAHPSSHLSSHPLPNRGVH